MKDNNFNFNQVFLNTIDSGAELRTEQLLSFLHLNNISANISEKSLSILLAKASFAFLLISMLSYWFQMSFKSQRLMNSIPQRGNRRNSERTPDSLPVQGIRGKELIFSKGSLLQIEDVPHDPLTPTGPGAILVGGSQEADHKSKAITYNKTNRKNLSYFLEKVPSVSMWSANITLALLLSIRWIESGHFPLSNLYESLIFLSWSLTVIHLFLENLFNKREQREPSTLKILESETKLRLPQGGMQSNQEGMQSNRYPVTPTGYEVWGMQSKASTLTLGAITSPVALFTNAFATFSLPQEMQKVTVLVPALKSNWLIMHVSVMIISYAALLSGSLLAMAFLVIKFIDDSVTPYPTGKGYASEVPSIMSSFINPHLRMPLQAMGDWSKSLTQLMDRGVAQLTGAQKKLAPHATPRRGMPERSCNYQYLGDSGVSELFTYSSGYQESEAEGSEAELRLPHPPLTPTGSGVSGMQSKEPLVLAQRGNLIKENKVLLPQILDNLSYRSISLGFALLTIGILSGAVWANEAWGSYWSWDPKETWALITWLVFALYLHTRLSKGWVGKESAFVASFGFIVIWFCYLGVNLFGKGLHSYGWFQQ